MQTRLFDDIPDSIHYSRVFILSIMHLAGVHLSSYNSSQFWWLLQCFDRQNSDLVLNFERLKSSRCGLWSRFAGLYAFRWMSLVCLQVQLGLNHQKPVQHQKCLQVTRAPPIQGKIQLSPSSLDSFCYLYQAIFLQYQTFHFIYSFYHNFFRD